MNAIVTIPATAREELASALRLKAAAEENARAAHAAVEGARAFVAGLEAKAKTFANLDAKVAAERAATMKAAVSKGEAPQFGVSVDLAAAIAEKMDVDNQMTAARAGLEELEREAGECGKQLAECRYEVGRKIEAVVLEVSADFVTKIAELENQALEIRALIEGTQNHYRIEGMTSIGYRIHEDVRRVLRTNAVTQIGVTNTPLNRQGKASHARWKEFIAALEIDSNAAF